MAILIIGAGQAALTTAEKYRALGGADDVTIISDENMLPYQRPPLSKAYLAGEMSQDRLYLRPQDWYENNTVSVRNGRVSSIDRDAKTVNLENGDSLAWDQLVLTTGARARPLPDHLAGGAGGLYTLRGISDIEAMRDEFRTGRKLLVIGGGYIGLEAAAIARKLGLEVTVVEAAPRILGRVASPATADHIRSMHQDHGVIIREGVGIEEIITTDAAAGPCVSGARLSDGSEETADFIIVGIGIIPNTELAETAGLACDQGILVDEYCRTSDPAVYAAGDCTRFQYRGELTRLESVGNAIDQGEVVAANLLAHDGGEAMAYAPKPWFWSDQFDMTLQIAGFNRGYDDTVSRPGAKEGSVSIWYYAGDEMIAVDAMGDPRSYMIGKRLIEAGKSLPKDVVADADANLKEWL